MLAVNLRRIGLLLSVVQSCKAEGSKCCKIYSIDGVQLEFIYGGK